VRCSTCHAEWDGPEDNCPDCRIAELEAENKALRELLTWSMSNIRGDFDAQDTERQNAMYDKALDEVKGE